MDLILLLIGLVLWSRGRFNFGSIQTEGRHVRAAGIVLMLPFATVFVLGFSVMTFTGIDAGINFLFSGPVLILSLSAMVLAVAVAYILIADPPNAPRLPGILGQIQDERRGKPGEPQQRPLSSHPLNKSTTQSTSRRSSYPSILSVNEAAEYMHTTPDEIMRLIDDGKLAAARGNMGFRIARSLLDEMKQETGGTNPQTS
ncbi:MAG: helix-turn-helix domain-containing protein [Anaerolineae bacterium]